MSKNSPYTPLSEAVALIGVDGEQQLTRAHVSGTVTLVGRERMASGWGSDTKIPRETFAAMVRFNVEENSIEAESRSKCTRGITGKGKSWEHHNSTAEDFREFEHAASSPTWGYVKVATNELHALKKSLSGRIAFTAKNAKLQCAIQHRLDAGVVPGKTMKWKDFHKQNSR